MKRLAFALSLTLAGCRAVERITASNDAFWTSPCHPEIYSTQPPRDTVSACAWHREHSR